MTYYRHKYLLQVLTSLWQDHKKNYYVYHVVKTDEPKSYQYQDVFGTDKDSLKAKPQLEVLTECKTIVGKGKGLAKLHDGTKGVSRMGKNRCSYNMRYKLKATETLLSTHTFTKKKNW